MPLNQIEAGDEFCKTISVDPAAPVVTIHVRNAPWGAEGARNARFDSYVRAIEYLLSKGFTVVKIGNSTIGPFAFEHGFIDLQNHGKAHSWLENYFLAKSSFLIGTNSGPILMPWTFGVPVLLTNTPNLNSTFYFPNSLVIPKLVRSPKGRVVSLEELSESPFSNAEGDIQHLPDSSGTTGYSWADNSERIILAATKEMISNLALGMKLDRRQEQAKEMVLASGHSACTPISQAFLREHSSF
jgi:putative glycosyltransferase (TIGR04372 family)